MDDIQYFNELVEILKTNEELRKSAQGIFKQMAWAAGGTAVGGVVLGPAGAMAGVWWGPLLDTWPPMSTRHLSRHMKT